MNVHSKEAASSSSASRSRRGEENYPPVGYEEETDVDSDIDLELSITAANDQTYGKKEAQTMNVSNGGQVRKQGQRGPGRKGQVEDGSVDPNKRCLGCQTRNTPLWRRGPLGYQTLCNACGLRYWKEEKKLSTKLTLSPP